MLRLKNNILLKLILLILFLFLTSCNDNSITILSYNVNCLFDDISNGTEFSDYDPSNGFWNSELFQKKLERTADVIIKSCPGGPDIICLQEIENENALLKLKSLYLNDYGYNYSVMVQVEESAINIGILSRLKVVRVHSHNIEKWNGCVLRNVLEAEIEYNGNRLYLFNNHWKSRLGGVEYTEEALLKASAIILERVKTILKDDPDADIVITGDLNEDVEEYINIDRKYQTALIPFTETAKTVPEEFYSSSIFLTDNPVDAGLSDQRIAFYETWYEIDDERGSYVYRNKWYTYDHFLLSAGLFDDKGFSYVADSFEVIRFPFLLDSETGFPLKWEPRKKEPGYSDHLPLLIKLSIDDS